MRNLKKVLALALVTVMLLGMMAMASAKGYADEDVVDAKYDVAVDVMQAIGVFEGTKVGEDTYLYPTNTLTRAEAAKVITYIAMTKANASKLGTADAPFADVAADHWAAGSIAYAKQMGIIGGVGNDNYDPNGTLTGYAFAKMLLVVLGYKAENQGYVNNSAWSTNVNADALSAGLLKGLDIDLAANITREQAAQMAFNALNAYTASYAGNTSITIGDVVLAVGGSVQVSKTETLAKKLYPTLELRATTEDAFGYNVRDWYLGTTKVATQKDYTVLATYAGTAATLTQGALYDIMGVAGTYNAYVNDDDTVVVLTATKGETTAKAGLADYAGSTVEFVKNTDGSKEAIVKTAYAAKVTKVTEATTKTDRKVEVTVYDGPVATAEITTKNYAKDEYVLVYFNAANAVIGHEAAATAYGTLTQTAKTAGAISTLYLDGAAVPTAGEGADEATFAGALNKKYTVVLNNGFAVYAKADAAAAATLEGYVYLNKVNANTAKDAYGADLGYYLAEIVKMDGTVAEIKAATKPAAKQLYKMTDTNADGIKELATFTETASTTVPFANYAWAGTMKATDKAIDGTQKAYFTADTKILTITTSTAGVVSGKVTEAPVAATFVDDANNNTFVVYSWNDTAKAYEAKMIVTDKAATATAQDLYYVVGTELGQVYVAAEKNTFNQYAIYNVKTGEKQTVLAASATTGIYAYTVNANGIYTFAAPAAYAPADDNKDGVYTVTDGNVSVYNNMITVSGDKEIVDLDAANAVIVDLDAAVSDITVAKLAKYDSLFDGYVYVKDGKVATIIVLDLEVDETA